MELMTFDSFRFETPSINLDIPPENYLIVTKDGNACLAILDGSSDR
uniref:Uncharacterized protein n=1 Tax=Aegilops tauschii subsp. strangulata TaxID=200361 RepID=A0A453E2A6_AEGTS